MSKPRKAYGYCRVSLDKMGDDSLEMQRRIVEAICFAEGFELVAIFSDVASGSVPLAQREQGAALLRAVKPGDIIVSLKLDRCFRDTADATATLGELQRHGSKHVSDRANDGRQLVTHNRHRPFV